MKNIFLIITIFALSKGIAQTETKSAPHSFYTKITVGVLPGQNLIPSFQIINGLTVNSHLSFGVGLGVENYMSRNYIPIFGQAKYFILDKPSSPFVSVICGYNFPLNATHILRGGFTTGVQVGLEHSVAKHLAFSTSLGYRYAYLKTRNTWWDNFYTIREINRLELRFGLIFK